MSFYEEMQEVASDVLAEFKQGTVVLKRTAYAAADPDTPWLPGEATPTNYTLDAVVRRVEQRYVDDTLILASDNQVTFAVPEDVVPSLSDVIVIDGRPHAIKDLRPIPAAGTPVVYMAFVAS